MAIPPDLMVRADTPGTARPIARISRPGSVPRHRDTAQSPLQTGKGRSSVAREEVGTTRIRGAPQGPPGDAVSIRFLAQILGQDLKSAQRPSIRRDSAAMGSDAYRRHGGEPAPFPARAVIIRLTV